MRTEESSQSLAFPGAVVVNAGKFNSFSLKPLSVLYIENEQIMAVNFLRRTFRYNLLAK